MGILYMYMYEQHKHTCINTIHKYVLLYIILLPEMAVIDFLYSKKVKINPDYNP